MERPGLISHARGLPGPILPQADGGSEDTLSSARIIALGDGLPPEAWLENRLAYLTSGRPSHLWGEDEGYAHPVLKSLARHRDERLFYLITPSEALSRAMNIADIRRTVFRPGARTSGAPGSGCKMSTPWENSPRNTRNTASPSARRQPSPGCCRLVQ